MKHPKCRCHFCFFWLLQVVSRKISTLFSLQILPHVVQIQIIIDLQEELSYTYLIKKQVSITIRI